MPKSNAESFFLNGKRYLKINNIGKLVNKFFRKEKKNKYGERKRGDEIKEIIIDH